MDSIFGKLVFVLAIIYFIFRIAVTVCYQYAVDFFGIIPFDLNLEIIVLFVTLLSFALIGKKLILGSSLYLLVSIMYYSEYIITNAFGEIDSTNVTINLFISITAIIIPLVLLLTQIVEKQRELKPNDEKREWFFSNSKYDRKIDERADKNNYRNF